MFADDTKLFTQSNEQWAREILQTDLDKLHQWSMAWVLKFHLEKCYTLKLSHPTSNQTYYMLDQNPINNRKRPWSCGGQQVGFQGTHLSTAKTNKNLGVIRRFFDHLTAHAFIQLYKARVRPILEYGHSVWQPALKTFYQDVQDVQRRATKLISNIKDKPYQEQSAI